MSLQELANCETFCKCSTTEPVLCDFTQLDNLQAAVFQFEIVVTFEEVAVICERQAQCTLFKMFAEVLLSILNCLSKTSEKLPCNNSEIIKLLNCISIKTDSIISLNRSDED